LRTFHPREIFLLRLLTFCVFAGRAWQHIFWDIPIRSFAWDEHLLKVPVESFTDMTWKEYVTSLTVDIWLQGIAQGFGWLCVVCAVAAWCITPTHKWLGTLLKIGGSYLILLFLMYWKSRFQSVGMFVEHTLQWATPFLLVYVIGPHPQPLSYEERGVSPLPPSPSRRGAGGEGQFIFWVKIAIALTFIGHGLYAFGYYPVRYISSL